MGDAGGGGHKKIEKQQTLIKQIAQRLGVDRAVAYTSSARLFQAAGGVVSMLLVATCLTGVEQGFYYTFASILAVQVFFELGLGSIITQFVAHEMAHLTRRGDALCGEERYRSRLASLLRFFLKWYSILAAGLLVVLYGVGTVFFGHFYDAAEPVAWRGPWLLLVTGTTMNFLLAPVSAFLEGLGKVKEIAFVRLLQQLSIMLLSWIGLLVGLRLYAASYGAIVGAAIFAVYVRRKFYPLLRGIFRTPVFEKISYRTEIFPYQWRIGVSWISGYFIFQLFNPVLFATEGAVAAGQMGMTLAGLNAIQNFALSWITTKVPTMSGLIARGAYPALDALFGRTFKQSMAITVAALIGFIAAVFALRLSRLELGGQVIGDRFLPFLPMLLMAASVAMNQYVFATATYLRCHKREPYMWQSLSTGLACVLSTLVLGRLYGMMGIVAGYAVLTVGSLIWCRAIFVNKKRLWHGE